MGLLTISKVGLRNRRVTGFVTKAQQKVVVPTTIPILIVSEDSFTRHLVVNCLKPSPDVRFEVYAIHSAEFSIEAYDRYRPKVVIADSRFSRIQATWDVALRPLLEKRPGIQVLVLDERPLDNRDPQSTTLDMLSHVSVPREAVLASQDLLPSIVKHIAER